MREALVDADFPAAKERIVAFAERRAAPPDAVRALRALPLADYRSVDDVLASVETSDAVGTSPSRAAAQARTDVAPGVARHMRTTED